MTVIVIELEMCHAVYRIFNENMWPTALDQRIFSRQTGRKAGRQTGYLTVVGDIHSVLPMAFSGRPIK